MNSNRQKATGHSSERKKKQHLLKDSSLMCINPIDFRHYAPLKTDLKTSGIDRFFLDSVSQFDSFEIAIVITLQPDIYFENNLENTTFYKAGP